MRSVAVVIPCYGYAGLLPEAIESALEQSEAPKQVIVVDDGSPDDTVAVAAGYREQGVEVVSRPNGGPGAARNSGAAVVDADFVVLLDADDRLDPHYVEKTASVLEAAPSDVGYVYTQCRYFGADHGVTSFPEWDAQRLLRWPFVHVSAMLRTELLRRFPYDERVRPGVEDWDFYLTLAEAGFGGVLVDEPLLLYRKHGGESRGDGLAGDPEAERTFHQILRKHWRLGGVRHALRVEAYYARSAVRRRVGAPRSRASATAQPVDR